MIFISKLLFKTKPLESHTKSHQTLLLLSGGRGVRPFFCAVISVMWVHVSFQLHTISRLRARLFVHVWVGVPTNTSEFLWASINSYMCHRYHCHYSYNVRKVETGDRRARLLHSQFSLQSDQLTVALINEFNSIATPSIGLVRQHFVALLRVCNWVRRSGLNSSFEWLVRRT